MDQQNHDTLILLGHQPGMEMRMKNAKPTPKIINNHDYIRVSFGNNRNLTVSWSGERASGAIPREVFEFWSECRLMKPEALAKIGFLPTDKPSIKDIVDAFVMFTDEIWPTWYVPPVVPRVGDPATYNFGNRRGGVDKGVVVKVRGTSVTVKFERMGLVSMAADLLAEGK
jgi:hypothetical protein